MSNTQVGNIYSQIISDVIDSSRVDFEEGGVDEHVLDELRMGWQQKLSQLQVATFPWDPKPEPAPAMSNPPTVPSNAIHYQQPMGTAPIPQNQGGLTMPQMGNNNMGNGPPRIKTEPGLDGNMNPNGGQPQQPYQNGPSMQAAPSAAERAAAHLHQSYGPRAAASINAIQGSRPQPPNGQHMTAQQYQMMQQQRAANGMQQAQARGPGQPGQGPGQPPPMSQEQYKAMMARQAAGQMQHVAANIQNGQNGVGGAQTDGAGDEVEGLSVIKQFGPNGEEMSMGRVEIDSLLRSKIEAMSTRMEGGGLMLPLKQASTAKLRKSKSKSSNAVSAMAQVDGGDDDDDDVKDEEVDEDAINSDLDDPEDTVNDEEDEDEGMGHIMLCMYDKVQRVKNKWKCVMKDGVLTVNGKEYVFHKASGEYEW